MSQFAQCKGGRAASCFSSSGSFACLPFGWLLSAYIVLFPVCARFDFGIQSISQHLLEAHRKSVRKVLESVEFNEDGIMFRVMLRVSVEEPGGYTCMAYISTVHDKAYTIHMGEEGYQKEISIEGVQHSFDWRQIAALAADARGQSNIGGRYSLLIAGKSYEVFARRINKPGEKGTRYEILVAGQRFEVEVEDEREKALSGSLQPAHESSEAMVRAPMPGLVLGLPMEPGAKVARGQTVVILEAMKMENDLASPINGTVKVVKVSKGQTVNQGDVLVVVAGD